MIAADVLTQSDWAQSDRPSGDWAQADRAGEHLQLLRSLSSELERAMRAIAGNDLPELEDSVATQQALSYRLGDLADFLSESAGIQKPANADPTGSSLLQEVRSAVGELKRLNLRYSILLKHSSRSVAMMAALLGSCGGQIQEASGARLKLQTWSCRM